MSPLFEIRSSNPDLLAKATKIAKVFAQQLLNDDIIGIVFLGAITRGYFDHDADVDIAIFKEKTSNFALKNKFFKIDGIDMHIWLSNYEEEIIAPWDMAKRWTFSQGEIFFDKEQKIFRLLNDKVPLKPDERRWLIMSGFTLSEWYINRLTQLWVERGNIISAHQMFGQGLNYFFTMLFGLNNELVADMKWQIYCAEKLERLPDSFQERIKEIMILHSFSIVELERRRGVFMEMWQEMKPIIEEEVHMTFTEMLEIV